MSHVISGQSQRSRNAGILSRIYSFWSDLRAAQSMAAEFAALNALSDTELARMGLTRSVLKRHLRQKHSAAVLSGPHGGWHDSTTDHGVEQR